MQAKKLKADLLKNAGTALALTMDDYEEVADEYCGVRVWWTSGTIARQTKSVSYYPTTDEKRYYRLKFHKRNRELIVGDYLEHVVKEGKAIASRNRQRKLYTNTASSWSHVVFEHPATFQTIAMEAKKKKEIVDDLVAFSKAEEYYAKIGRTWKRGYLLYGPPGTGKSSMIAAMANFLGYDIYDLELGAVDHNNELKRLLIETTSKSIIVIEDIDCSVDLTRDRVKKKIIEDGTDTAKKMTDPGQKSKKSSITLSRLLNFVDGIWSCCGKEKVIVFTTNHAEKLDPALIRRGRMDKHIELSYCGFEAFKVLANNSLSLESHQLFDKIDVLLQATNMTPADVAENLMPKTHPLDAETCLKSLIGALEMAKELQDEKKAEKEEKSGANEDALTTNAEESNSTAEEASAYEQKSEGVRLSH